MDANNIALCCLIIVLFLLLLGLTNIQQQLNKVFKKEAGRPLILIFSILGIISVVIGIFAPYIFTNIGSPKEAATPNIVGDTLGGTMGPFIAIAGVIFTFLAFYMQKVANDEIKEQFRIQQFESRIYKMMDVYQTNIQAFEIKSRFSDESFSNKSYFYALYLLYAELYEEVRIFIKARNISTMVNQEYANKLAYLLQRSETPEDMCTMELSYLILFFGVDKMGRENIKSYTNGKYKENELGQLLNYLSRKPADVKLDERAKEEWKGVFVAFDKFDEPSKGSFVRFYNGQQSRLGHYFRQLYMMINYINNQKELSYEDKWDYVKIIRSQFSNHEQLIIFLNSISTIGRDWELNHDVVADISKENSRLITKYDLIKNIPKGLRNKYGMDTLYPNVEYEDVGKLSDYRQKLEKQVYN